MVVDRDREVIAGRRVLAGQHDVAEQQRLALDAPVDLVDEVIKPGLSGGLARIEAQAEFAALGNQAAPLLDGAMATGAGIDRPIRSLRRADRGRNVRVQKQG